MGSNTRIASAIAVVALTLVLLVTTNGAFKASYPTDGPVAHSVEVGSSPHDTDSSQGKTVLPTAIPSREKESVRRQPVPGCSPNYLASKATHISGTHSWKYLPDDATMCGWHRKAPRDAARPPGDALRDGAGADEAWKYPPQKATPELRQWVRNKRFIFVGDSLARNTMVMTYSRLCNYQNLLQCQTRMLTADVKPSPFDGNDTNTTLFGHGPFSCVSNRNETSRCLAETAFSWVPLPGLTAVHYPRSRRRRFLFNNRKIISPLMVLRFTELNATFVYLPVNWVSQITQTLYWLRGTLGDDDMLMADNATSPLPRVEGIEGAAGTPQVNRELAQWLLSDYTFVSIGAHLDDKMLLKSMTTLPQLLKRWQTDIHKRYGGQIVWGELVHRITSRSGLVDWWDRIICGQSRQIAVGGIPVIPTRHFTQFGRKTVAWFRSPHYRPLRCGYYDDQHPSAACQLIVSDLLLTTFLMLDDGTYHHEQNYACHGRTPAFPQQRPGTSGVSNE